MKFAYLKFIFVSLGTIWAPVSYAADLNEGKDTEFFELLEELKITISEGICTDNIQQCEDQQICYRAAANGIWNSELESKKYVEEAQRREMSCGVLIDFRQIFSSQTKLKRQQLQYALKKLNFYNYSIDGLWGKGTEAGFQKFRKEFNLSSANEVFQALLKKVEVPGSFAKNMPDRWRVTCVGGAGALSAPIFWDLKSFNEETGQMELVVTDRDGIKGKSSARILNNKIDFHGESVALDENYNFTFDVDFCPGGMTAVALK